MTVTKQVACNLSLQLSIFVDYDGNSTDDLVFGPAYLYNMQLSRVILDSRLTLSAHLAALCQAWYYQLWQLCPLVQSMMAEPARAVAAAFKYPVGWTIVIHCSTVCRTSCSLCRMPLHDRSLAHDVVITSHGYYANSIGYPSESV